MITEFAKRIGLPKQEILGDGLARRSTDARALYWYILSLNGLNYSEIGRQNNRTPAAVLQGVKRVKGLLEVGDARMTEMFERVKTLGEAMPMIKKQNLV
jgi:hypothetical protein